MGNKSKKANVEVAAVPVFQSGKKGKRDAGKVIEKPVAKKQKNEVQKAIQSDAKKPKKTAAPPPKKKPEPSSSEEESEEESSADEEPATKPVVTGKKSVAAPKKKAEPSPSEEESESEESDEEPANSVPTKQVSATTNGTATPKDTEMEGSDSEDSEESESDEEEVPATTNGVVVPKDTKMEEDDAEASDESESDDEEEPTKPSAEGDSSEGGSEESSDESEEEKPSKPTKKGKDVAIKDTPSAKANQTPKNETKSGSKTLFAGNLSWSVDGDALSEFFKEAGEVVDVRLATNPEGKLRGFGHVEFATPEGAQKALELNGKEFLGRELRLDLAQQRDGSTPHGGKERGSVQKQTVFVKGFDKFQEEGQIKSSLEKHFGSCGEISRLSIPMDSESGASKGIAYMDFTDGNAVAKALELNGSSIGDYLLTVDEAKPKGDNSGRGGGRSGGGRSSGRGRFGGGGRGGGRGRFGGGGGGRGGNRGRGRRSFWDD